MKILFCFYIAFKLSIQDKTFGLKNKKGKVQQKFIQQVHKQVMTPHMKVSAEQAAIQKKKDEEAKKKAELNDLFRPVQALSKGRRCMVYADGHAYARIAIGVNMRIGDLIILLYPACKVDIIKIYIAVLKLGDLLEGC